MADELLRSDSADVAESPEHGAADHDGATWSVLAQAGGEYRRTRASSS